MAVGTPPLYGETPSYGEGWLHPEVAPQTVNANIAGGQMSAIEAYGKALNMEFTAGIDGSSDVVGQLGQGVVNAARTIIVGGLKALPTAVHTVTGQEFTVSERSGVVDGTAAGVRSTFNELKSGNLISGVYTAATEIIPDGPVLDLVQSRSIIVAADK